MTAQGWQPGGTTGDRKLDAAIARFIHDPRTLRCDIIHDWPDYWARGGRDGRPEPRLMDVWSFPKAAKGVGFSQTVPTRHEVMATRAADSISTVKRRNPRGVAQWLAQNDDPTRSGAT